MPNFGSKKKRAKKTKKTKDLEDKLLDLNLETTTTDEEEEELEAKKGEAKAEKAFREEEEKDPERSGGEDVVPAAVRVVGRQRGGWGRRCFVPAARVHGKKRLRLVTRRRTQRRL